MPRSDLVAAGLMLAGGVLTLSGVGVFAWARWGPQKPPLPPDVAVFQSATRTPFLPVPATLLPSASPVPTATSSPHASWEWNGVDFASGKQAVVITIAGTVQLMPFVPYAWTPTALQEGIFDVGNGTGLAWNDDKGRVGLWLHSGLGQTASALQNYIERDEHGYRRSAAQANAVLADLVRRYVYVVQGPAPYHGAIIAAGVRVPPIEVAEVTTHVGDLVEYLAGRYPERGFEELVDRTDVLLLYFCGLHLAGEEPNPAESFYRQARFVVALIPDA